MGWGIGLHLNTSSKTNIKFLICFQSAMATLNAKLDELAKVEANLAELNSELEGQRNHFG